MTAAPAGFRSAAVAAGLAAEQDPDLVLVANDGPARGVAGVVGGDTAPALWNRQVLGAGQVRAVLATAGGGSGGAGDGGFHLVHAAAERVAHALELGAVEVAVYCAGPPEDQPPRDAVLTGVDAAAGALAAAGAVPAGYQDPAGWRVGVLLAAGGITVLGTDVAADARELERALRQASDAVGVPGSATVLVLSSGASGTSVPAPVLAGALATVLTAGTGPAGAGFRVAGARS